MNNKSFAPAGAIWHQKSGDLTASVSLVNNLYRYQIYNSWGKIIKQNSEKTLPLAKKSVIDFFKETEIMEQQTKKYPHPSRVTVTGDDNVTGLQPEQPSGDSQYNVRGTQSKIDDIENKALDQETKIHYLSGIHRFDTSNGSPYNELRQKGYSDLAARYILYKQEDLIDDEPYDLSGSELDEAIERELGAVFYKNYTEAWEIGRLDRISGSTSELAQQIVSIPGGADGYQEGKAGIPKKDPTTYYAIKMKEHKLTEHKHLIESVSSEDKSDIKDYVMKLVEKELKGKASKKLINDVIKDAMTNLYKTLWLRRATWLSGI